MPRVSKQKRAAHAREQRKKLKKIAPELDPTTWMLITVETEDPEPELDKLEPVPDHAPIKVEEPEPDKLEPVPDEPPFNVEEIDSPPPEPNKEESEPVKTSAIQRCLFCSRALPGGIIPEEPALHEKMEYVLATTELVFANSSTPCCTSCSQMFDLFYDFKKNCLSALSKQEKLLKEKVKVLAKSAEEPQELPMIKVLNCPICPTTFSEEEEFGYHTNEHYGIKPFRCKKGCRKAFHNPKESFMHEVLCSAVPLKDCNFCVLSFPSESELERHKIIHDKPKFQCPRCIKSFFFKPDCDSHERACQFQDQDPLQYIEPEDPLQYLNEEFHIAPEAAVQRHVEEERNFMCETCDTRFKSAEGKRAHQQIHKKPYACPECGHRFRQNCLLKAHMVKCRKR